MNRLDIQRLQSMRGYPALSLLLPTHRTAPDNRQDPIRVGNLVRQAADRLQAGFSRRDIEPLLARLEALVAQIDFRYALDGLALFVNRDFASKFYLPLPVKERVIIDETFATRDLVYALNHSPRYWVLALSEKPTRLYEGLRDTLLEDTYYGFPMTHQVNHRGPGGAASLPGDYGGDKSAHQDERRRQFFRQVDTAFGRLAAVDPLPLVIVGVDRHLAFFCQVSKHKDPTIATLHGNHDGTAAHELATLVRPLVDAHLVGQRQEALEMLGAAVGAQRYVSGIGQAWRAGQEGRCATLLVEEDFHYPACLGPSDLLLRPLDDLEALSVIDDAVDELIEAVLARGGRVVFVDSGALEVHHRIAMILRY